MELRKFFGTADYTDYTEFGAYGITDLWNYGFMEIGFFFNRVSSESKGKACFHYAESRARKRREAD